MRILVPVRRQAKRMLQIPARLRAMALARAARRPLSTATQIHLGCGPHVLPGWANIDLSASPGVIRCDLSYPLPIRSGCIRFIFHEHLLEHLPSNDARGLLRECRRVLAPDGVLRISTPDLRRLVQAYQAGRTDEWHDVGYHPATPCQMLNGGMRLWGHRFVYDADELRAVLAECGFRLVVPVRGRESAHRELQGLERRPDHGDLIVEATP